MKPESMKEAKGLMVFLHKLNIRLDSQQMQRGMSTLLMKHIDHWLQN